VVSTAICASRLHNTPGEGCYHHETGSSVSGELMLEGFCAWDVDSNSDGKDLKDIRWSRSVGPSDILFHRI